MSKRIGKVAIGLIIALITLLFWDFAVPVNNHSDVFLDIRTSSAVKNIKSSSSTSHSLQPLHSAINPPLPTSILPNNIKKYSAHVETGWWTPFLNETARVFHSPLYYYNNNNTSSIIDKYSWCIPTNISNYPIRPPKQTIAQGLLYVKSHKASSSTCEGVNIAIAHHVGRRIASVANLNDTSLSSTSNDVDDDTNDNGQWRKTMTESQSQKCQHYNRHLFAIGKRHGLRDPNKSLLWTFVRHPRSRDVSQIFHFLVSWHDVDPNNTQVLLEALHKLRSTQSLFLSPNDKYNDWLQGNHLPESRRIAKMLQQQVFQYYDFIGITERMYESLAVMTLLWDLDPTDVIVLSAKQAGNEDSYDAGGKGKCSKLLKPLLHPDLANYLNSSQYIHGNADFLLYYAAHLSLDWTIQSLGFQRVQDRALLITKLQQLADKTCHDKAIFPCSKEGVLQIELSKESCYFQDAGCGYQCVDQLMEDYRLGKVPLS